MLWRAEMQWRNDGCYQSICSCQKSEVCLNEGVCIPDMSNSAPLCLRVFSVTA